MVVVTARRRKDTDHHDIVPHAGSSRRFHTGFLTKVRFQQMFHTEVRFQQMFHTEVRVQRMFHTEVRVHTRVPRHGGSASAVLGMIRAPGLGTMARTYREMEIWQLAEELRNGVIALLATLPVGKDGELFAQLRDAAASPARNIAEGFGRFEPRDHANFLRIAKGSLDEIDNHLRDLAHRRRHTQATCGEFIRLAARCRTGVVRLRRYLLSPSNPFGNQSRRTASREHK